MCAKLTFTVSYVTFVMTYVQGLRDAMDRKMDCRARCHGFESVQVKKVVLQ